MIENPEYRARLRRKLEKWPDGKGCPVTINDGLELLAMVEHQEKTIKEWRKRFKNRGRKNKSLKSRISRLEQEADWLACKCQAVCELNPSITCTKTCPISCSCSDWPFLSKNQGTGDTTDYKDWREAAKLAVEQKNE